MTFIVFILILTLIISLHELGHFYFAKKSGMRIYEYSIGMGPLIYTKKKNDIYYSIRAIPIGGFVSIAEEKLDYFWFYKGKNIFVERNQKGEMISFSDREKETNKEKIEIKKFERTDNGIFINNELVGEGFYKRDGKIDKVVAKKGEFFENKSFLDKFSTLFAGPAVNIVLGLIFFVMFSVLNGVPIEKNEEGFAEVGGVYVNSPSHGVLEKGDYLLSVNGTGIEVFSDLETYLEENMHIQKIELEIIRGGIQLDKEINSLLDVTLIGGMFSVNEEGAIKTRLIYQNNPLIEAGGKVGDEITMINDQEITTLSDFIYLLEKFGEDDKIELNVLREGENKILEVNPWSYSFLVGQNVEPIANVIGVFPPTETDIVYSLFYGGFEETGGSLVSIYRTFGALFSGRVSVSDLSGPVGIFAVTDSALRQGVAELFWWIGFLSVNIGIINLFPLPILDGGRITLLGIESVSRKKMGAKIEATLHAVTVFMLMAFMIFVTYNDIVRFFFN